VSSVSCGNEHTVATNRQGQAFAWGLNSKGMLGIGKSASQVTKPQLIDKLDKIVQVSCGTKHTLFLDIYGHAFACGSNKHGRLGIKTEEASKEVQY
jgi:alpha-tubulin suppressor-like RCC1 family protein